ncbi:helix-turn-helix domain-containing protein [Paenibacillus sp. LMG 31461]|uniref:Helix-turn-helix domain-containing protein n=1 Tax=Paenibacillus plantarum TaxID=2654975 RepID=A0ABX1XAW0_9BACL|nr:helix-turn-helix domain-containing protein [Paenibacillus plantarum]NOU65595.1 helix-turn-helix domain-containing protein [Paenibacillus plantarum]
MWTVLLVEDEGFVREALRETVDWECHGFRVAGEAGNGREALAAILELKPDVVIADIVMPGMDGIELLKETRKAGIRSRFIMLTAMSHFDYVRDALQYGAFNYLLKLSLNDEVLLENLARIKGELLEELRGAGEALYPLYHRTWSGIRGTGATVHEDPAGTVTAAEKFRSLWLDVIAVLSGAVPADADQAGIRTEEYLLVQSFYEGGQTTFFCWSFQMKADHARWNKPNRPAGLAAGSSLARLSQDWRRALNQLNGDWYGREASQVKERHKLPPVAELEAELIRCFEERNETKCAEVVTRLWDIMEYSSFSHMEVKMLASHLLHIVAMLVGRKSEDHEGINSAISHESLLAHVLQTIREHIRHLKEEHVSFTDHPEVNRVIQYMLEHYKENIRVADLAKLVAINVDYLSTVFGKKTGLTPIAYLQNIRIEQAKRLLLHAKLSVEEIAFQTGFADDAYFIKVFKRMVGQTPSSFRRENNI